MQDRNWLQSVFVAFIAIAVVIAPLALPTSAYAQDNRAEARAHYESGKQLFSSGDYKGAIAEFAAADSLAPAAMLEFNIALCYDRLGDAAEALRRYRVYLRELPSASNRASVEGKIRRLEGELRSAAAAKAVPAVPQPAPLPPPVVLPTPAPTPAPEVPTRLLAPTPDSPTAGPEVYTPGVSPAPQPVPATAPANPAFARVAAIDINAIRDQRTGAQQGAAPTSAAGMAPSIPDSEPPPPVADPSAAPKASKPLYKQWWFWVVVGLSAAIIITWDSSDSSNQNSRLLLLPQTQQSAPTPGRLEWRF